MSGFGMVRQEVHDAPRLLLVVLGVGLEGVHHVGELHAIPHEEHGEVVAHLGSYGTVGSGMAIAEIRLSFFSVSSGNGSSVFSLGLLWMALKALHMHCIVWMSFE